MSTPVAEKSLIEVVESILLEAIARGSSTIRFVHNPAAKELWVFEKIGTENFVITQQFSERLTASVMARLKIMAQISISEHHIVQIGHTDVPFGTCNATARKPIRVIVLPTLPSEGYPSREEIVIQILNAVPPAA